MIAKSWILNVTFRKMQYLIMSAFVLFFATQQSAGAQPAGVEGEVLMVSEEMPSFPGGPKALIDAINRNIVYPEDAIDKQIEGKVVVRFIIDKEGKVVQPSITKGLLASIDKEVLKSVSKLPKFNPGKNGGKAVNVWYAVPVTFKISK